MRHRIGFPALALMLLLTTGCWDRVEVNDMALIISAGVDIGKEDKIEMTIQVFIPNPASAGTEGSGGGEGNVYTLTSRGASMADALSELQKKLPRYFSWGHAKAYFFGEELARRGMFDEFDFLFRDIQTREQANFFVCRGTARQLLESQVDPNTYETLIKLSQKPLNRSSTMHEIEEVLSSESQSFILPVIAPSLVMMNKTKKQLLSVDGMSVIQKQKLIGFLTPESVMGIRLLRPRDLGRNITITQELDGGKIVIKIMHTKIRLNPSIVNGEWKMKVRLTMDADIVQNSSTIVLAKGSDTMRRIEEPFNEKIKGIMVNTLQQLQTEQKADVVGFARAFHKKYPHQWKAAKGEWETRFQTMDIQVEVDSSIQRPGIANISVRKGRNEVGNE
ncbi:Ger(x)C family spore germination protein [Paenibacillus aceris]|uniref:Spore germination protein KC n=1 Tax=Paenibacillus aceris TaxID=869555 RepID=A0ABS4I0Q8_9BACL|nr:Ger(x)C family spore germination protein [Paenibacillus aceris]MBP1964504.1 spore germination protein KC [Paenibacillus aceris]NHW35786.1 Ger(x)C family spore germination protein [Paenibacillus aceris]